MRYVLVGGVNTGLSFGVYALGLALGASIAKASLGAIVLGILLSFMTQGTLVFGDRSPGAFVRFVINWSAMYTVHVAVVVTLRGVGINPYLGGVVALVVTTSLSYLVLRDFVFRSNPKS